MSEEKTIVDNLTTTPPQEEQKKEVGAEVTPKETPSKASKNFEKLLKQRSEAKKEAEDAKSEADKLAKENALLKKQLEEKKEPTNTDMDSLIEKKISERFSKVDNEARQKADLIAKYPEARDKLSQIEQVAKAHPSLPYEQCYQLVNPVAFTSVDTNTNLDGGKAPEVKKKAFKDMTDDELLNYWG